MATGTTDYNLIGFIHECIEELRGIFPEGSYISDDPDINPGIFPYITMYAADCEVGGNTPQEMIWLNQPVIMVVVPLDNLQKAISFLAPYWEQIPIALQSAFIVNGRSQHAQNIGIERMTLSMGPIEWIGGAVMFGITIRLNGVKITNTVPLIS